MNETPSQNNSDAIVLRRRFKVVIPALNEESNIGKIIDQIVSQNVPCDIVVADNRSDDGTRNVVLERQSRYLSSHPHVSITIVDVPERGVSNTRNAGARLHNPEDHDYTFFLDADTRFYPGFFNKAMREMESRGLDMGGCMLEPDSNRLIDQFSTFFYNQVLLVMEITGKPGCVGAGIVIKPETFQKIGGFDTEMRVYEDATLAKRASEVGKVGMLSNVPIIFSSRRLEKEGRLNLFLKYLLGGVYYLFTGRVWKGMKYEFGHYNKN